MGAWGGRWHMLEPWAGGLGGRGCEPWSPTGAAAAPRGQRPAWGCSCRGWFGCQAPYGDTASFWRLATKFSPYQKEKQPRPFPDLEESLAALSGPRAGFQSGVSPSLPSPGQARAGRRLWGEQEGQEGSEVSRGFRGPRGIAGRALAVRLEQCKSWKRVLVAAALPGLSRRNWRDLISPGSAPVGSRVLVSAAGSSSL